RPQIRWALGELRARLGERGVALGPIDASPPKGDGYSDREGGGIVISIASPGEIRPAGVGRAIDLPAAPESFAIFRDGTPDRIVVYGADLRGLIYAITELADRVRFSRSLSDAFDLPVDLVQRPTAAVRSVSKSFQSEIEDLSWFHDRSGWEAYLTHLVTHRFN